MDYTDIPPRALSALKTAITRHEKFIKLQGVDRDDIMLLFNVLLRII